MTKVACRCWQFALRLGVSGLLLASLSWAAPLGEGLEELNTESIELITPLDPAKIQVLRDELAKPIPYFASKEFWYARVKAALQLGNAQIARDVLEQAIKANPKDGPLVGRLWSILRESGTQQEIIEAGERRVAMTRNNPPAEAHLRASLARDYVAAGNVARAEALLEEARRRYDPEKNPPENLAQHRSASHQYDAASRLAMAKGRYEDARRFILQAIDENDWCAANAPADDNEQQTGAVQIRQVGQRVSHGLVLMLMGKLGDARAILRETEQFVRKLGRGGLMQTKVLAAQAKVEMADGRFNYALALLRQAAQQQTALGVGANARSAIQNRHDQIVALIGAGHTDEALSLAQIPVPKEARINEPNEALGVAMWRSGYQQQARMRLVQASKTTLELYGPSHYLSLRDQALLKSVEAGLDAKRNIRELGVLSVRLLAARRAMARQEPAIEKTYRQLVFEAYLQALARQPDPDQASINIGFQLAEALRNSQVENAMLEAAARAAVKVGGLDALAQRQQEIRQAISAGYDNLASQLALPVENRNDEQIRKMREGMRAQEDELTMLQLEMERSFPSYARLTNPGSPQLAATARLLRQDEVFISIYPGQNQTFVWAITRDQPAIFFSSKLGERDWLARVQNLRATLDVGNATVFDVGSAHAIYTELLAPLTRLLVQKSQLIVNASGSLGQIPFALLVTAPPDGQTPAWLIRTHAVSHIASVTALSALRLNSRSATMNNSFIGFGDPQFSLQPSTAPLGSGVRSLSRIRPVASDKNAPFSVTMQDYAQVPPLPETRDEILAIAGALGADPAKDVFLGKAASRKTVLSAALDNRQIIVFSTHGLIPGDLPGLSQPALALSADEAGGNPLLLLEDVLGLKLNADWVVLSACNTASASGETSEAISGLGRGFFYAGARALLVTQWAVETESAKKLVIETFRRYAADPALPRTEALRQAQLALMNDPKYAHPFFWAPYVLVGDGGRN